MFKGGTLLFPICWLLFLNILFLFIPYFPNFNLYISLHFHKVNFLIYGFQYIPASSETTSWTWPLTSLIPLKPLTIATKIPYCCLIIFNRNTFVFAVSVCYDSRPTIVGYHWPSATYCELALWPSEPVV